MKVVSVCAAALAGVAAHSASAENLLDNPGFESVDATGATVGWTAATDV